MRCLYCKKRFGTSRSWTRHLKEIHDDSTVVVSSGDHSTTLQLEHSSFSSPGLETEALASQSRTTNKEDSLDPALFFSRLRSSGISDKHFESVVTFCKLLSETVAEQCVTTLKEGTSLNDIDYSELPAVKALDEVGSVFLHNKFITQHDLYVEPTTITLGRGKRGRVDSYQVISIKQQLQNVFLSRKFERFNLLENEYTPVPGSIRDIFDGTAHEWQKNRIYIILFYDEFDVVCPLGNKTVRHKLGALYCTIANLPLWARSQLDNIFLVALFPTHEIRTYGWSKILKPVVDELLSVEQSGCDIYYKGTLINASVRVECLVGDNAGIHSICGFYGSFSRTNRLCRACYASPDDLRHIFRVDHFRGRTQPEYVQELQRIRPESFVGGSSRLFGLKCACPFLDLKHFDIVKFLPFDVVHDLLEGVVKYVLNLLLTHAAKTDLLNLRVINSVIDKFDFKAADGSKPEHIRFTGHVVDLNGTASDIWTLVRFLPLILFVAGYTPVLRCSAFKVFIGLSEILTICLSPTVFKRDCDELQVKVEAWLVLLKLAFP